MTDSKGIKSNEKNGPWGYQRNDFLLCRPCYKKHSCKYCFFYLIETDRLMPLVASQARRNGDKRSFTVASMLVSCCTASSAKSLNGNEEKSSR
jgi:hypothetical protein